MGNHLGWLLLRLKGSSVPRGYWGLQWPPERTPWGHCKSLLLKHIKQTHTIRGKTSLPVPDPC